MFKIEFNEVMNRVREIVGAYRLYAADTDPEGYARRAPHLQGPRGSLAAQLAREETKRRAMRLRAWYAVRPVEEGVILESRYGSQAQDAVRHLLLEQCAHVVAAYVLRPAWSSLAAIEQESAERCEDALVASMAGAGR